MKKTLCFLMIACLLLLSACGENPPARTSGPADSTPSAVAEATETPAPAEHVRDYSHIDMDLSVMPVSLSYPLVTDMFANMNKYDGMVIKMTGTFRAADNDTLTGYYYQCNVTDVTACCFTGLEFLLEGDPPFPEGYPEEGSEITIVGYFCLYEEDEFVFPHLVDTVLLDCKPPQS